MAWLAAAVLAAIAATFLYAWRRRALLSLTTAVGCIGIFILVQASLRAGAVDYVTAYTTLLLGYAPTPTGPLFTPPWTPLTAMYLHLDPRHLVFNVLGLVLLTPILEERIGTARFAVLYLLSGLTATAGYVLVHLADPDGFFLLGASGAISGALGGFARLYPRERVAMWLVFLPLPPMPVAVLAGGYVALSALLGIGGLLGNIAWEAHVVGLFAGYLLAPALMRWDVPERKAAVLDLGPLRELATTPKLKEALAAAEQSEVPEIRLAWVDRFVVLARCPRCSGPLARRGRTVRSPCGWRARL